MISIPIIVFNIWSVQHLILCHCYLVTWFHLVYNFKFNFNLCSLTPRSTPSPSWWWRWPLLRSLHQLALWDQRIHHHGMRALGQQLPIPIANYSISTFNCFNLSWLQVQVPRASTTESSHNSQAAAVTFFFLYHRCFDLYARQSVLGINTMKTYCVSFIFDIFGHHLYWAWIDCGHILRLKKMGKSDFHGSHIFGNILYSLSLGISFILKNSGGHGSI